MEKSPIILKTPPQKAINCPASGKGTLKTCQVPVAHPRVASRLRLAFRAIRQPIGKFVKMGNETSLAKIFFFNNRKIHTCAGFKMGRFHYAVSSIKYSFSKFN
jgi:hypothetical protein